MSDEHERLTWSDDVDEKKETSQAPINVQRTATEVSMVAAVVRASQNRQVIYPVCKVDDDLFLSFVIFVKLHIRAHTHTLKVTQMRDVYFYV